MKIPFMGGAYTGRSPNVSSQQCINYYYEAGKDGESLVSTPGASVFNDTYAGEVRGGVAYNDLTYWVIGNQLIEMGSNGSATSKGTLNTAAGLVSMAHNGTRAAANQQIMIADGAQYYIYDNVLDTLSTYAIEAESVFFFDGYFVYHQPGTDRFWNTNLYNGKVVTGTDFYTAEGDPDEIVSLVADQRQIFALGEITLSGWYNSGDATDLFQRFQGGYSQTGCVARDSAKRFDNGIIWLSQNERGHAQVVRLGDGYQPKVVSTPEINYQFSTYAKVDDAFAYVYQQEGHEFYVLTFPTAMATWVYDASTQEWHQRAHAIAGQFPNRERYNCHVFAFGKHLMGDFSNGTIYELDSDLGTLDGAIIERIRISGNSTAEEGRVRLSSLQLDMEEGIGDPNDTDDTKVYLSYSKDGGHTFTDEVERFMGDVGDYARRVIWRRLGWARNWIFKIRTWTPHPHIIKGLIGKQYGEP